jgi:uncharacterized repeat protein (TIGR01451 family)
MKRTLRFLTVTGAILLSLLSANKASAQITSISANLNDSAANYCSAPADVWAFVSYFATGTPQPLDSITFYVNWGDGSDTTFKKETTTQGWAEIGHHYATTGVYTFSVTLTNTNSVTTTVISQPLTLSNGCAALNGDVWIDADNDCIFDLGEQPLLYHAMKITNTTTSSVYYAWIDANGHYATEVPDGYTYDIELNNVPGTLTPTCPNTSGVVSQAVSGGTYTNDFGYECQSGTVDYSVAAYSGGFRPGFDRPQWIYGFYDNYCSTTTATVTLTLDPLLTYSSSIYGPTPTVSGQTVTWTGVTLGQFNSLMSSINVYTDVSAVIGSTICNTVYITYSGGPDADITNDTVEFCGIVSNSFDPNDKSVSPNEDAIGTIQDGEMLYYHINFQNTGNDTAYNVVVTDQLDANLDMNTFQFLGASHPVNVTWLDGNILNFRFENIYLPDSNVNEPASHGYLDYKIAAKTGLAPATAINNTAEIYFDFNEAIITNTTLNTIETPQSVQNISNGNISAKVFPNPANNELIVTTEGNNNFTATVYDVVGRSVAISVTNHGKAVINTSSLANGMYILSIKAGGKDMTTKVNIQH